MQKVRRGGVKVEHRKLTRAELASITSSRPVVRKIRLLDKVDSPGPNEAGAVRAGGKRKDLSVASPEKVTSLETKNKRSRIVRRAFERQDEESAKAYRAFAVYRDLGPERTLRAVAEALYGIRWKYGKRTVEKWSSSFDWVARARGYEDHNGTITR
jgi:hypothetical protein